MVSTTTNIADVQQNFMNNITQQDQQNCIATVNSSANNNVVIINGTKIDGNVTGVSLTATTDASCLMVSNMEDSVQNILAAVLQQTNTSETDWFNGFQITNDTNTFNISQSVTNNINQINESTCASNTITSADNNYVYVTNSVIGGNFVGVTESASASASCSMNNTMKNTTYNQVQASGTQSNTIEGMFVAIVGAFAAIIGLIIIGAIIFFAVGPISHVGYSTASQQAPPRLSPQDQELMAAQELGLSPNVLSSLNNQNNINTRPVPISLRSTGSPPPLPPRRSPRRSR